VRVPFVPTADDLEALTSDVDGWLHPDECRLLYELGREADPAGVIVEIGSWQGKSTICLAAGAMAGRGARVVAIDPHRGTSLHGEDETTEPALRRNLERAGVADQVEVVVATSEEAEVGWERPVSLLWIDGDHAYESAKNDLGTWEGHVMPGAAVAMHDTFLEEGPERVVRERLIGSRRYTGFRYAATITAATKRERVSGAGELARLTSVLKRNLYGMRLRAYSGNALRYRDLHDGVGRIARALRR
jgi:predicted O-methyltransferase YrrM